MADLRLWSREVITDFIELYKSHQCLWDVKCDGYKSKYMRISAYKDLVQFCKNRGFPEANRDFVARKIQGLRGSFRKELRKTEKYKRAGIPYESNLWYYTNLLFTHDGTADDDDQKTDAEGQSNDDDNNGNSDDDDENYEKKFLVVEDTDAKSAPEESSPPPVHPPKRRKRSEMYLQPEFLDIGQERYKDLQELTEFELTGMNVAKKLSRMNDRQAIYAESLISSVIRKGLLNKLKEETDLCDNMCCSTNKISLNK